MKKNTIHQLGVVDSSSDFLDESDISEIDVGRLRSYETENRVDSDRRKDGRILRNDLPNAFASAKEV